MGASVIPSAADHLHRFEVSVLRELAPQVTPVTPEEPKLEAVGVPLGSSATHTSLVHHACEQVRNRPAQVLLIFFPFCSGPALLPFLPLSVATDPRLVDTAYPDEPTELGFQNVRGCLSLTTWLDRNAAWCG